MGIKYQQNYQVPFYESDAFKKMRISSLLAVALQISGEQSTALGRSDVWVFERYGLFWAVIEYELTIHRLPEFNEKITIETEATSYNKFFCYRNFSFLDENGEVLVEIRSTWVLMDKATRKIDRVLDEIVDPYESEKVSFTQEMKDDRWTILCPQMSPIHFQFVETAMNSEGYNFVVLPSVDKDAVEQGLKYVNNDACYPAILVIGEIISALKSGKYDLNNTSVMISQTGGGCRATNYIAYLKKALIDSGFTNIPIISANLNNLEDNPGFKLSLPLVNRILMSIIYGDLLMKVLYRVRPYEKIEGSANDLYKKWVKI